LEARPPCASPSRIRPVPRPGSLLDPEAPTLSVIGTDSGSTHDEIEVYHRGDKVWTIDALQFGLQTKQVWLLDVVLLPEVRRRRTGAPRAARYFASTARAFFTASATKPRDTELMQ
jgi:hypothetical protein